MAPDAARTDEGIRPTSDIPDGLDAIYRKLMAKEPKDRFASADQLAEALAPFTRQSSPQQSSPHAPREESRTTSDSPKRSRSDAASATSDGSSAPAIVTRSVTATLDEAPVDPLAATSTWTSGEAAATSLPIGTVPPRGLNRKWLRAAGGAAALVMLGVIIITITNKDGTKTKIEVPGDSKVEITTSAGSSGSQPSTPNFRPSWHGWPADAPPPAIAPFNAEQAKQHQQAWAKYLGVPVEYTNTLGMKFRLIPPGEFTMGNMPSEIEAAIKFVSPDDPGLREHMNSEGPQHQVVLTQPIYLAAHEVTQAQYKRVMGQNPSHFAPMGAGKDAITGMDTTSHPVEMVDWNDAAEFCAKLCQQGQFKPYYFRAGETVTLLDGTGYRLPTEAEWEFAGRSGTLTKYWVGAKDEDLPQTGWFQVNSDNRTHAVGELKCNPFGLYDIHGNVWQWVQDWWGPTYYAQVQGKSATNPGGPSSGGFKRAIRGGCWNSDASANRASFRLAGVPTYRLGNMGFRVSLPVDAVRQALKVTGLADRRIAEWVLKMGGSIAIRQDGKEQGIEKDGQLPQGDFDLITADFEGNTAVNNENVGTLRDALRLRHLGLGHTSVSDRSLEWIGNLTQLEHLCLWHSQITGKTVERMQPLTRLKTLLLNAVVVGDESVSGLANANELERLGLDSCRLTDAAMPVLATLTKLRDLGVTGNDITAKGIEQLDSLQQLETLGTQ